jgi:phosphoglycerate dehydrogenase-like enzyme
MRVHIHNPAKSPPDPVTLAQWHEAAARAGAIGEGHTVSVGDTEAELRAALTDAEALIITPYLVKKHFPLPAPRLKLVFSTSAGIDSLVPFDMLPDGVMLVNNSGTHSAKAGEYCIMALLMLANRMPLFATNQRREHWDRVPASVIAGRTVGIVGVGGLGGPAAAHAKRFGLRVIGVRTRAVPHPDCERVVATEDLDSVLPELDFLLLACPLTPQTRHLLDRRRIALLPRRAGVINIGRGGLIEQDALLDALDEGALEGAVLDVFSPEPVPAGHRLWATRNLIMTPHMSCDDPLTYNAITLDIFFRELATLERGERPENLVDRSRAY